MTNRFFSGQTDYIEQLNALDGETADHIADTTGAHAATAISNTPAGNIAATTVQAAINELDSEKLSASATALPSSFASASINSVTPTGGTLAVTGAISATNSTGRIDANDSRAAGVGVGGSLFLRGKDANGDYQDFTGINAFLTDGTVGNVGADLIFKTRLSGTLAERMRLLSYGDLLINQTTNPSGYKLAVTGNVGVTGSINATGNLGISNIGGTAEYPIDVIRADASAVSLRIRNDSASANAYSMVGVNASGNAWGMRMGSAAANSNALEWVLDAFSSPVVKMSLTTAGNLSVTGSISATGNVTANGSSITGSINATGNLGISNIGGTAEYPIDVIRADASAVSLRIRNDSASANAYSMVGVNASGNAWGMRMGSAAANSNALEWVLDAFSSPVVKMSLTTAGNLSVTGAINATGTIASSNALETLNSGSLYQYNAGSTTFFRSRNDGNNLDVSYNGGGVITRTNTSGFAVTGLTTTDTLRVNVTPTAETPTATHTAVFNINGTNYKFLCLVA